MPLGELAFVVDRGRWLRGRGAEAGRRENLDRQTGHLGPPSAIYGIDHDFTFARRKPQSARSVTKHGSGTLEQRCYVRRPDQDRDTPLVRGERTTQHQRDRRVCRDPALRRERGRHAQRGHSRGRRILAAGRICHGRQQHTHGQSDDRPPRGLHRARPGSRPTSVSEIPAISTLRQCGFDGADDTGGEGTGRELRRELNVKRRHRATQTH